MLAAKFDVPRGCGDARSPGSIYVEVAFSTGGTMKVDDCILDPPIPVPSGLNVPYRGMILMPDQRNVAGSAIYDPLFPKTSHLVDRIGMGATPKGTGYYNVADFIEEVRVLGLSRKMNPNMDLSSLNQHSTIMMVHDRGLIDNADEYYDHILHDLGHKYHAHNDLSVCPKRHSNHRFHTPGTHFQMCAGLWWQDIEGGEDMAPTSWQKSHQVSRKMPGFTYLGYKRPTGVDPLYIPAFVARFPITRLSVIQGKDMNGNLDKARRSKLNVFIAED